MYVYVHIIIDIHTYMNAGHLKLQIPLSQVILPWWNYMCVCVCICIILVKLYVTVLAKTRLVRTKTESNFITTVYRHTQYLSIPSVSSVKC